MATRLFIPKQDSEWRESLLLLAHLQLGFARDRSVSIRDQLATQLMFLEIARTTQNSRRISPIFYRAQHFANPGLCVWLSGPGGFRSLLTQLLKVGEKTVVVSVIANPKPRDLATFQ
jgi:hypothetical protein